MGSKLIRYITYTRYVRADFIFGTRLYLHCVVRGKVPPMIIICAPEMTLQLSEW